MGVVSAAKGHSTLVGWATIMTFANVALIVLLMRASLGTSRNAPLQLQAPGSPPTPPRKRTWTVPPHLSRREAGTQLTVGLRTVCGQEGSW